MNGREALCECGHPRDPNHLTPGAECSQSGAPGGCGCVTFKLKQSLFPGRFRATFEGLFFLWWLLPDSYVKSAGDGSGAAIVVNEKGDERRVDIGDIFEGPL